MRRDLTRWRLTLARRLRRRPGPEPARAGLLLVDLQRLFTEPASPARVRLAAGVLGNARLLLAAFRAARRPVAHAVYACARPDPANPMLRWWRRPPCAPGSRWARPARGLEPAPGERVFAKQRYSAFRGTRLAAWLRRRGVADLVVMGVRTNLCVESTARDAFEEGFRAFVALDACAASSPAAHRGALLSLAQGFAGVAPVRELAAGIRAATALPSAPATAVNTGPDGCQCLILERPAARLAEGTWRRNGGCFRRTRFRARAAKPARSARAACSARCSPRSSRR